MTTNGNVLMTEDGLRKKECYYTCGAYCDLGYKTGVNEDYFDFIVLDKDVLFSVIADGMGSQPSQKSEAASAFQPAGIVVSEMLQFVKRAYDSEPDWFLENPKYFLKEAIHAANRVLSAFKVANEPQNSGFGASVTCCLLYRGTNICFAHTGNTRLYLIRMAPDGGSSIRQLTKDNTKAQQMVDEGILLEEQYYGSPACMILTEGIGIHGEPAIQTFNGKLRNGDIILLTTDGIHYAIIPEAIKEIVLTSGTWETATRALVDASKLQKHQDNMTALLMYVPHN